MVNQNLSQVLKAVADPTRRRILELLAEGPRTVSEIAALFPISRPAISKHLRVLREAGLAGERRRGRRRIYSRQTEWLEALTDWLTEVAQPPQPGWKPATELREAERPVASRRTASDASDEELSPEGQEHEWRSW